ncbi:MAG: pilus assembly protein [Gammaproteobacteria bacterium]|nr:pilus assembly protein [Gammaproteobacteria bacterium]MDE2273091.1 pilus assembly protein [Gammaproteobacteria bacterium]
MNTLIKSRVEAPIPCGSDGLLWERRSPPRVPCHRIAANIAAPTTRNLQQGVVLIVSLVLLLVLTILGIAAIQSTSLEERMAGNQRAHQLAFEAAEAALRQGEQALNGLASLPPFDGSVLGYYPNSTDASGNPLTAGADWQNWNWASKSIPYTGTLAIGGNTGATASYYIEAFVYAPGTGQSLDVSAPVGNLQLYAITARGVSPDGKSVVILQSTYRR